MTYDPGQADPPGGNISCMVVNEIVVGLDGSPASVNAARWAMDLGELANSVVRGVSTWKDPDKLFSSLVTAIPSQAALAALVAERVEDSLADADLSSSFAWETSHGHPGPVLADATKTADLVVVGRAGDGHHGPIRALTDVVLGSTARYCLHHQHGPVAVVPETASWVADPTVVVGVDGSAGSVAALRWATETLPETAQIQAVTAISPYREGLMAIDPHIIDRTVAAATRDLEGLITEVIASVNGASVPPIVPVVVVENPRYAIVDPDLGVDLIVVGERGHGAIGSILLGSIADHAVRSARCPVVVVPAEAEESVNGA